MKLLQFLFFREHFDEGSTKAKDRANIEKMTSCNLHPRLELIFISKKYTLLWENSLFKKYGEGNKPATKA